MKRTLVASAMVAMSVAAGFALAHSGSGAGSDMKTSASEGARPVEAEAHKGVGVVKNVYAAGGKVTLQHEAIASVGWPAMTMAFDVKDKKALAGIKPGQKVEFTFVKHGGDYLITSIR